MRKVHALAYGHKADAHNPGNSDPVDSVFKLAYRTALCGQVRYCSKELINDRFTTQFSNVFAVAANSKRASETTCLTCRRIAKFG